MSTNVLNQTAYLRSSREFPKESEALITEIDKMYIDTANAVNSRTIGLFPTNRPAVGGESWFFAGGNTRNQNLRQIYPFTAAGNVAHGINFTNVFQFSKCSGAFTDGTNWYGAIFASNVAIAGQVSFFITPTNIVILSGIGAPTITSGTIVLEWLSKD